MIAATLVQLFKGKDFITRLTEQFKQEVGGVAITQRPYSVPFTCINDVIESFNKKVTVASDLLDSNIYTQTDLTEVPFTIKLSAEISFSLEPFNVARHIISDAMDGRPPISVFNIPFFDVERLRGWYKYNQMLIFSNGRQYRNLIISDLTINQNAKHGYDVYAITLTLTKVSEKLEESKTNEEQLKIAAGELADIQENRLQKEKGTEDTIDKFTNKDY